MRPPSAPMGAPRRRRTTTSGTARRATASRTRVGKSCRRFSRRSTLTDDTGRFLLTEVGVDYQILIMDGSTANAPGKTYGTFDYGQRLVQGKTTVLPFTVWMPLIDTQHATEIPVPTLQEIVATTPRIPYLEIRIPADVVLQTTAGPLR